MMTLLDRVLLRRGLLAIAGILLLASLVVIGFDLLLDFNKLMKGPLEPDENRFLMILTLGWHRLPELLGMLLVLACMAMVPVVLGPLLRRRQLVALGASGISLARVARPLMVLAVLVGLVDGLVRNHVAPHSIQESVSLEDRLRGRSRHARSWLDAETGATWFTQHIHHNSQHELELRRVLVAYGPDQLTYADTLTWKDSGWVFTGRVLRWQQDQAAFEQVTQHHPAEAECPSLPPDELLRHLVKRHARDSSELLASGTRIDRALVYRRWLGACEPILAVLMTLLVFLRLDHATHLLSAAVRALALGAIPPLLLALGGRSLDAGTMSPLLGALISLLVASLPIIWVWWHRCGGFRRARL